MLSEPLISVIMPVYNSDSYLKAAVDSIIRQTYKNLEIICVNDCSTDKSPGILKELAVKDSRVTVIDSPVNVGAGHARNLGIRRAKGEYITFVDADDTIDEDLYEKVVERLRETNADEIIWGITEEHFDEENKLVKSFAVTCEEVFCREKDELTSLILSLEEKSLFGYQCNSLYRRDILKDNKIEFEKAILYEDFFFNLEYARHAESLAVLEYAGYHYLKRVNFSITHRFTRDYFDLSYRRIEEMYRFCTDRGFSGQKMYDILGNRLLRYTFSALSRNYDPLSQMSRGEMKAWAEKNTSLAMYSLLLPRCNTTNPAHRILKLLISKGCAGLMVMTGKAVYRLKK